MTLEYARWKKILIFVVLAFALLYSLPNMYRQDRAVQISASRNAVIDEAVKENVQGELERAKIPFKRIDMDKNRLLVRLDGDDNHNQLAAQSLLREKLGSNYSVALNLASTVPPWLQALKARPMTLGLDLQGGIHFLMQVDERSVLEKSDTSLVDDIKTTLRDRNIRSSAARAGDGVLVTLRSAEDRNRAMSEISVMMPGAQIVEAPASAEAFPLNVIVPPAVRRAAMDQAIEQNLATLRNRINLLGVAEPVIQRQGTSRIAVQLPGVQDTALAKKILGATATLEYRLVDEENNERILEIEQTGHAPAGSELYRDRSGRPILLKRRAIASGDEIVAASKSIDPDRGTPAVSVVLNDAGGAKMLRMTEENVGRLMAVVYIEMIPETRVVNGVTTTENRQTREVISVATIQGVFGKRFNTTGLSATEAEELSLLLRSGSLSAPMTIVEERVVGPSLGRDNIEAGLKAVLYAFAFVMVFFLIYYRTFGIVTNIALLMNLLLVVAVMSIFGATLTLPGLAGIALTVGMSVDANVLINERIREELRAGSSPLASIAIGYEKAAGTILDANVTALIGGIALFAFGSGPIRGFALSLCVGILTSMYTAVSVSRGAASLFYGSRTKITRLAI